MKKLIRRLLEDESGQATTEYILMMSIAVALVVSVIKKLIQPILKKLSAVVSAQMDKTLFGSGASMHRLNIGH